MNKTIGKIKWRDSEEVFCYKNKTDFIAALRKILDVYGVSMPCSLDYNKKDIDLCYEVHKAIGNEFGAYLSKKQFVIENTSPKFQLQDKLKVIYKYDKARSKKNIYESFSCGYILNDNIVNSMSTDAIKKWVDRRYKQANQRKSKTKHLKKHRNYEMER